MKTYRSITVGTDTFLTVWPRGVKRDGTVRGALIFHPRNSDFLGMMAIAKLLAAEGIPCMTANLGGPLTYGNDAAITAVGAAVASFEGTGIRTDGMYAVSFSMGCPVDMNYARTVPGKFKAMACTGPFVDMSYGHDNNVGGFCAAEIEAAYTNLAGWNAAKATHDPTLYVAAINQIPVWLRYSQDDELINPATVTAFAAAHGKATLVKETGLAHGALLASATGKQIASALRTMAP